MTSRKRHTRSSRRPVATDVEQADTREQILAAAVAAASTHGVARLSMTDVARTAGISRPTLYRYFDSKQDVLAAALLAETATLVSQVIEAVAPLDDPAEAIEMGILVTLRLAREHPLLDRIVRTEPESLVPLLVAEVDAVGPSVLSVVRQTVEALLSAKVSATGLDAADTRRLADVLTRLLISYVVNAPDEPPELVASSVSTILALGALTPQESSP
jgi:TetR/AcrR family transcriptional regulator, repressor for uid operon